MLLFGDKGAATILHLRDAVLCICTPFNFNIRQQPIISSSTAQHMVLRSPRKFKQAREQVGFPSSAMLFEHRYLINRKTPDKPFPHCVTLDIIVEECWILQSPTTRYCDWKWFCWSPLYTSQPLPTFARTTAAKGSVDASFINLRYIFWSFVAPVTGTAVISNIIGHRKLSRPGCIASRLPAERYTMFSIYPSFCCQGFS